MCWPNEMTVKRFVGLSQLSVLHNNFNKVLKKMFSKLIVYTLNFFAFCGFYPEFFGSLAKRINSQFIFIIHIFLGMFFVYYFQLVFSIDKLKEFTVEYLYSFIAFLSAILTYWVVIIESYLNRNNQKKLWRILQQIDRYYAQHNHVCFRSYLAKYWGFSVSNLIIYFLLFCQFFMTFEYGSLFSTIFLVGFLLCFMVLLEFCTRRIFYYLFYLEVVQFELKLIETETLQIVNAFKSKCVYGFSDRNQSIVNFERRRFVWIREYYLLVWKLCDHVNSTLGWSTFAVVLYNISELASGITSLCDGIIDDDIQISRNY